MTVGSTRASSCLSSQGPHGPNVGWSPQSRRRSSSRPARCSRRQGRASERVRDRPGRSRRGEARRPTRRSDLVRQALRRDRTRPGHLRTGHGHCTDAGDRRCRRTAEFRTLYAVLASFRDSIDRELDQRVPSWLTPRSTGIADAALPARVSTTREGALPRKWLVKPRPHLERHRRSIAICPCGWRTR